MCLFMGTALVFEVQARIRETLSHGHLVVSPATQQPCCRLSPSLWIQLSGTGSSWNRVPSRRHRWGETHCGRVTFRQRACLVSTVMDLPLTTIGRPFSASCPGTLKRDVLFAC